MKILTEIVHIWQLICIGFGYANAQTSLNCVCDRGYASPVVSYRDNYCRTVVDLSAIYYPTCSANFGNDVIYTDYGKSFIEANLNTSAPNCGYFKPNTTVLNCFAPNGTITLFFCTYLHGLLYLAAPNCTEYYTVDDSKATEYGMLEKNFLYNPCNNCQPYPAVVPCQLRTPTKGRICPYCAGSSLSP